jgi:hypothetical protein
MRPLGFSTGALAYGDFRAALTILGATNATAVELSALRQSELEPLVTALSELQLERYTYVSIHLPSAIHRDFEPVLLKLVDRFPREWPLVTHPDVITSWKQWEKLGARLCIENMDKRKSVGQTASDLKQIFEKLPEALFCFDLGHAHQIDPTMGEAVLILEELQGKLCQLHVSEVNSESKHDAISLEAASAFEIVSSLIPEEIPAILESRVSPGQVMAELALVAGLLSLQVEISGD